MWVSVAGAAETVIPLTGAVTPGGPDHLFVEFEVPAGTRELEVRHDDGSADDILDWGLRAPDGAFRGWGGGNAEPAVVGEHAASRSYVPGALPAGRWSVVIGKAKVVSPSVTYTLEVVLRDAPTLPPQPERRPFEDPGALRSGPGWYAGDLHVHSRESGDADATLDEIAALALEQGLDFVVITDHDTTTGSDFLVDAQARWPELLFVPGTEYTTYDGHATAFGATRWVEHALGDTFSVEDAVAAYVADDVFFSLNHPELDLGDLCIGCAWALPVPDGVGGIEAATGKLEVAGLFTEDVLGRWEARADRGQRLTPLGGSDDHRAGRDTGPLGATVGLPATRVWAEELSIAALRDGLRAGRTMVQLGGAGDPLVELVTEGGTATATVSGALPGDELQWVVDGRPERREDAGEGTHTFVGAPGQRVRVELGRGGPLRVATGFVLLGPDGSDSGGGSPRGEGGGGCGCETSGSGHVGGALLLALVTRWRRRSVVEGVTPGPRRCPTVGAPGRGAPE